MCIRLLGVVPKSSLQHTLCSSRGRLSFGCDNFPICPMITQHTATVWSLCSLFICVLNFQDKHYIYKAGAENITCLVQSIERKIFSVIIILMTSTKLCAMNWPLTNHFQRKEPNNTFKLLYAHSFLLHFILPLFKCWLVYKITFFRKCSNFYISFHIIYMSLITHITCFLYSFLTQQLGNKVPNYPSQINTSSMAPNPSKMLRGATCYQVGECTAAVLPLAIYSVNNGLY